MREKPIDLAPYLGVLIFHTSALRVYIDGKNQKL